MSDESEILRRGETALPELMTVRDFVTNFRMGRTTFYREVHAGRLHIIKFGRSTRIAKSEAIAWLARLERNERVG